MTRRIRDRERLKRETEDSKRALEHARQQGPGRRDHQAPPWPRPGMRPAIDCEPPQKR
jgi:hypothetical protein